MRPSFRWAGWHFRCLEIAVMGGRSLLNKSTRKRIKCFAPFPLRFLDWGYATF